MKTTNNKIECECGSTINAKCLKRHLTTKKHLKTICNQEASIRTFKVDRNDPEYSFSMNPNNEYIFNNIRKSCYDFECFDETGRCEACNIQVENKAKHLNSIKHFNNLKRNSGEIEIFEGNCVREMRKDNKVYSYEIVNIKEEEMTEEDERNKVYKKIVYSYDDLIIFELKKYNLQVSECSRGEAKGRLYYDLTDNQEWIEYKFKNIKDFEKKLNELFYKKAFITAHCFKYFIDFEEFNNLKEYIEYYNKEVKKYIRGQLC